MESKKYDVAIIGSGLGALACASFMTRMYHKKVVVIEQHSALGGLSQAFLNKDNVPFEIGIHQVGELEASSMFSKLMNFITVGENHWRKLPDTFIKFHFPDFIYEVSSGATKQIEKLVGLFPEERENIASYYKDVDALTKWYRNFTLKSVENNEAVSKELLASEMGQLGLMTTEAYLKFRFSNKKLRSLIACHWTDYGLPPKASAFLKHALLVNNHKEGVYYPEFGSGVLINAIQRGIEEEGGQFLLNTVVKKINYQGDRASSLQVYDKHTGKESEIEATYFVSGIGAISTYSNLFDQDLVQDKLHKIKRFKKFGTSFVKLFATLKTDPGTVGADASLSWVYPTYDHNQNFENKNKIGKGVLSQYSISFPSLKKTTSSKHSMKINSLIDYTVFQQWENGNEKSYEEFKKKIGKSLLDDAEKLYPGLNAIIDSWDLYTPLDAKNTTQHHNGNIFGIPDTPERYRSLEFNCRTPLKNVYLTGSDITSSGIYATVLSSVLTTNVIFEDKQFFMKVLSGAREVALP